MFYACLLVCFLYTNAEYQGVHIVNSWPDGYNGYILLVPAVDLHGWKIRVKFNNPVGTLEVTIV